MFLNAFVTTPSALIVTSSLPTTVEIPVPPVIAKESSLALAAVEPESPVIVL